jgi:hypothetical protein
MKMDTNKIITGRHVQHDPSGVGHAWQPLDAEDCPVAEDIACWIIERDPEPGAEMTGSDGQHYRLPPE